MRIEKTISLFCILHFSFSILFALILPAQAYDAKVKTRTALCREAKENCQPIFYLSPADQISIEGQSTDSKWLKIRHLASKQSGWAKTADIQMFSPSQLSASTALSLETPALALAASSQSPPALSLIDKQRFYQLESQQTLLKLKGLSELQGSFLRSLWTPEQELRIYGLSESEQQSFIQELRSANKAFPEYKTLLRLQSAKQPWAVARAAEDPLLLVLGAGQGPWGKSLLVGLDQNYLPVMLIREAAEILAFIPAEARLGLRPETLRLQDLDAQGGLIATVYHTEARREVIMRVVPRLNQPWEFTGFLYWPKEIPFRAESLGLKLRLWHQGDQNILLAETESTAPGYLAYYVGANEALTVKKLEKPLLDGIFYNNEFWSLQSDAVLHWQAVKEETIKN